jgi:hypothetical protein
LHSLNGGIIAQSVEQRTENPCVAGSIPADTTIIKGLFHSEKGLFRLTFLSFGTHHAFSITILYGIILTAKQYMVHSACKSGLLYRL